MMKRFVAAMTVCGLLATATAWAAEKADVNWDKIMCVVASSNKVNSEKSTEFKEGKVYFCCSGCMGKFEKAKEKHASKAHHQLIATKQYKQKACPFSGGDVNPEKTVTVKGVKVGFCCGNCQGKAEAAEGEEQIEMLFGEKAFKKGFEKAEKDDA